MVTDATVELYIKPHSRVSNRDCRMHVFCVIAHNTPSKTNVEYQLYSAGGQRIYCNWHSLLISSRVFCVSMISSEDVRCRCIHLWTRPQKCWEIRFCLEANIWVASDRCMQMEIHGNHLFRVSFLQVLPWILFGTIWPFLRRYSIPFDLVRQTKD